MATINRKAIFDLSQNDPVIRAALTMHLRGEINFEQAIMTALVTLHNQNAELRLLASKLVQNEPAKMLDISQYNLPPGKTIENTK